MRKTQNIIWGIILVAVGIILALRAFGFHIDIFFDGWWTLFIIVPCLIGLIRNSDKTGNIIGLAIGVFLLLACQDIIEFKIIWQLIFPAIIVFIGAKLIFKGTVGSKNAENVKKIRQNNGPIKAYFASFSSLDVDMSGEKFEGLELNASFGGIECDLRNAYFEKDAVINVSAIFGGIDIIVPDNINIKKNCTCIFGGVSDSKHKNSKDNSINLYISGTCLFGGVEIK